MKEFYLLFRPKGLFRERNLISWAPENSPTVRICKKSISSPKTHLKVSGSGLVFPGLLDPRLDEFLIQPLNFFALRIGRCISRIRKRAVPFNVLKREIPHGA